MHKCEICDKEFDNYRKLNGHKSVHRSGGRYSVSRKTNKEYSCLSCGSFPVKAKYCSNACQREFQWKQNYTAISNGKVLSEGLMRRYITEVRGYICEHCSVGNEWNGKSLTLQLDHIDGNSDNNELSNLRWLCPNCHTQTQTWCGRNKKNTKRNRYLRKYKTGVVS